MATYPKFSPTNDPSFIDNELLVKLADEMVSSSDSVRPKTIRTTTTTTKNMIHGHSSNIQADTLFESNTYQRLPSDISISTNIDQENEVIDSQNLDQVLVDQALTEEIKYRSQIIIVDKPIEKDEMVDMMIDFLNQTSHSTSTAIHVDDVLDRKESSNTSISTHPYPPINRTGPISDHDRPYVEYGHLDAETIAKECNFCLDTDIQVGSNNDHDNDNDDSHENQDIGRVQHLPAKKRLSTKSFAVSDHVMFASLQECYRQ